MSIKAPRNPEQRILANLKAESLEAGLAYGVAWRLALTRDFDTEKNLPDVGRARTLNILRARNLLLGQAIYVHRLKKQELSQEVDRPWLPSFVEADKGLKRAAEIVAWLGSGNSTKLFSNESSAELDSKRQGVFQGMLSGLRDEGGQKVPNTLTSNFDRLVASGGIRYIGDRAAMASSLDQLLAVQREVELEEVYALGQRVEAEAVDAIFGDL